MRRVLLIAGVCACAGPLDGQQLRFGLGVAGVSFSEESEELQYDGGAVSGFVDFRFGRFAIQGEGYLSRLTPDAGTPFQDEIKLNQGDVRLAYFFTPALALQLGASTRRADPEFSTTDVGFVRIGLMSESELARIARLWVRGAYLPSPRFSGGGKADFAFEIGLGTWIGTANRRFGARLEYDFQRIDRQVKGVDVPQQMMVARLSLEVGF